MSIFDKDCPLCGSELPVSANGCKCGFSYEPNSAQESAQDLEIAVQDEQLYANYLAARVIQTKEAIEAAKVVLDREPENQIFINDLVQAKDEHKAATLENEAQIKKLAIAVNAAKSAKAILDKARAEQEQQRIIAQAEAKKEAEEARLRAVARAQTAREEAAKEEARAKRAAEKQAKIAQRQAQEILAKDEERLSKRARRAAKASHERQVAMAMALVSRVDEDIKQARKYSATSNSVELVGGDSKIDSQPAVKAKKAKKKVQPSIVVSSKTTKPKKVVAKKIEKIQPVLGKSAKAPVITKKPDLVFKARQAIKAAAAIMSKPEPSQKRIQKIAAEHKKTNTKTNNLQENSNVTDISEVMTRIATPEFNNKQRRNSDKLSPIPKLVRNAPPTCPHCTGELKSGVKKCKCGFEIEPSNPDGFELVLSDADKEAMEAFSYISITKMS